ncbi:carotenoid biosynthesis protein [Kineococcus sp. SYSU DK018]|uniref:carotenoid biosynthesis protein n=1 Tax=Kineococcus sp. SYSU DK018 TaxID=3383139 RepID=UPI003D7EDF96
MPSRLGPVITGALTAAAVLTQVAHPLLRGEALRRTTIGSVGAFCAAAVADATRRGGVRGGTAALAVAGGLGLVAEAVGTRTGRPFGRYRYAGTLGPQVLDVPVVVPLAWTMVAWPSVQLGRRLAPRGRGHHAAVVAAAAWTLASWDLFLDPQMTAAGHWSFEAPHPHLPGLPGIPVSNYAGWLLTATAICAALHALVPEERGAAVPQAVPGWLLGWTWLGSALGNAVFFRRPAAAAWGGAAMGLTVGPYLRSLRRRA